MSSFRQHFVLLPSTVQYANTTEYRNCLRRVFRMDLSQKTGYSDLSYSQMNVEDLDAESNDELLFDDSAISVGLDYLYEFTKDVPEFQDLYDEYAGKMLSTDRTIGQAVLCSYDHFPMYYAKVWEQIGRKK